MAYYKNYGEALFMGLRRRVSHNEKTIAEIAAKKPDKPKDEYGFLTEKELEVGSEIHEISFKLSEFDIAEFKERRSLKDIDEFKKFNNFKVISFEQSAINHYTKTTTFRVKIKAPIFAAVIPSA